MNHNTNISRNKVFDRLPVHHPDEESWKRISKKLDEGAADGYREALSALPVHKAPSGLWESIESQLSKRRYRLAMLWLGIATAASLAIFAVLNFPAGPGVQPGKPASPKPMASNESVTVSGEELSAAKSQTSNTSLFSTPESASEMSGNSFGNETRQQENILPVFTATTTRTNLPSPLPPRIVSIAYRPQLTLITSKEEFRNRSSNQPAALPLFTATNNLKEVPGEKKPSKFSLALGYNPESIDNGYDPTVLHNVDLTASVDINNIRVKSSMGMAYNSEHLNYEVNSTQRDNIHNGTYTDTVADYEMVSQFEGVERHGFASWDISAGYKLFAARKLTAWINAGAGLAVRINNASLRDATIEAMKNNYNATVNSINIDAPGFNRMNMSLVSGIEFDYYVLKRLSVTLQPQARYYLHPIFRDSGNSPDSFSLGFRTGMKFDL